jgi:hypothetical protein
MQGAVGLDCIELALGGAVRLAGLAHRSAFGSGDLGAAALCSPL